MTDAAVTPPSPPATSQEARAVLDTRIADKDWGAKLLSGDAEARREYSELRAKADAPDPADAVAAAMAGIEQDGPFQDSSHVLMVNMTNMFRELGISDPTIKQTLEGYEVSQEEHDVVARIQGRSHEEFRVGKKVALRRRRTSPRDGAGQHRVEQQRQGRERPVLKAFRLVA